MAGIGYKDGGDGTYGFQLTDDGKVKLGNTSDDVIQVTGSLAIEGEIKVNGSITAPEIYATDPTTELTLVGQQTLFASATKPVGVKAVPSVGKVFFAELTGQRIRSISIEGDSMTTLVSLSSAGHSVDVDEAASKIYWTEYTSSPASGRIKRADLDGSNEETLIESTSHTYYGIALDVASNMMYWVENSSDKIWRAAMDGSSAEVVATVSSAGMPRDIALDIANGTMYWTNDGSINKIQKAPMAGGTIESVVSDPGTGPLHLSLDTSTRKVYWTDSGATADRGVYRADMDGGTQVELLVSSTTAYGIDVESTTGKVFWTAYHDGDINVFELPESCLRVDSDDSESLLRARGSLVSVNGSLDIAKAGTLSTSLFKAKDTTEPSTPSDSAVLYAKSGEMYVKDSSGNETQISPHDTEGEWQYYSRNSKTGKVVRIKMEKMIRKLEELTGESFIEEE